MTTKNKIAAFLFLTAVNLIAVASVRADIYVSDNFHKAAPSFQNESIPNQRQGRFGPSDQSNSKIQSLAFQQNSSVCSWPHRHSKHHCPRKCQRDKKSSNVLGHSYQYN